MALPKNEQRQPGSKFPLPIQHFLFFTNPEPWRVPPMSPGRNKKTGKLIVTSGRDELVASYQEEIREELVRQGAYLMDPGYKVDFFFHRIKETINTGSGVKTSRNRADATNMQKALEDALQGTVIHNDADVVDIHSRIVPSGSMTSEPFVFVRVIGEYEFNLEKHSTPYFHQEVIDTFLAERESHVEDDNTWTV